ncbi:hypothetical protein [Endozoicomonas sp. ALB060]|uniref:hypothetical protein n=1 Tax=Endozoicomonas sp. ALB060 TaxID=3403072 RepID=UPI003BB5C03B
MTLRPIRLRGNDDHILFPVFLRHPSYSRHSASCHSRLHSRHSREGGNQTTHHQNHTAR